MNADERKRLAEALAAADEPIIKEIVREAEAFLTSQLQSALAADQRAMTFAAVIAAIVAFMIGGVATLVAAEMDIWPHILPIAALLLCLIASLSYAVSAARPTDFHFCGNDPRHWITDIAEKRTLVASLAGQASLYSRDIELNDGILVSNQRRVRSALQWAWGGVIVGAGLELMVLLLQVGATGWSR